MDNSLILEWYIKGFKDELNMDDYDIPDGTEQILRTAYHVGSMCCIGGDDVRSLDNLSDAEIIEKVTYIHNAFYSKIEKNG